MTLDERTLVAHEERLTLRELRTWVRKGWVRPAMAESGLVFDEVDLARVRLLCDLRKDMELPRSTVPVVLNLIDQLHQTRREMRQLVDAVDRQPDHIRASVLTAFRARIEGDAP